MLSFIVEVVLFFMIILSVSVIIFATLVLLVGNFFHVTIAQDSILATIAPKCCKR